MHPGVFIETDRLYLRQWKLSDHPVFINMNSDKEVMEFFPSVLTPEQTLAFIDRIVEQINNTGYGLFAIEKKEDRSFLGFAGLAHPRFEAHFTPCIEIGWRLHKHYWNQGFATEAAKACLVYAFNTVDQKEICSFTSVLNKASEKVMQKIGMQYCGTFAHPLIKNGHALQEHVLYKITKESAL